MTRTVASARTPSAARPRTFALLAVWLIGACAHAQTRSTSSESVPAPMSVIAPDANVFFRFRFAQVRSAPFASQLSAFIANSGTWHVLARGSASAPVTDIDTLLCATRADAINARGVFPREWVFVLEHPLDEAEVRRRLERMARESGRELTWSTLQGLPSTSLPVDPSGFAPHALLITGPHEVVVTSVEGLARAAAIAGHATSHDGRERLREPALEPTISDEVFMLNLATRATDDARFQLPDQSFTPRIEALDVVARRPEGTHDVIIRGSFTVIDSDGAIRMRGQLRNALHQSTDTTMARMLGLAAMAASVQIESSSNIVTWEVTLDDRQVATILGALTLAGVGR